MNKNVLIFFFCLKKFNGFTDLEETTAHNRGKKQYCSDSYRNYSLHSLVACNMNVLGVPVL